MPAPLILLLTAMLAPLGAFFLLSIAGRRMGTTLSGAVGTVTTLVAFSCSLIAMMQWLSGGRLAGMSWGAGSGTLRTTVSWAPGFLVGVHVDSLTIVTVTGGLLVSSAIHVFATGYLRHDIRGPRCFALMSLSNASLVGILTSASLPQWAAWAVASSVSAALLATPVPLGPGGLGITPVPRGLTIADLGRRASAALTLLVVRCIGDAALLLACGVLAARAPGLDWARIWAVSPNLTASDPAGWLLLLGACFHASAFPACFFLPDAKGSPTPVAALAYSVTLLPAGVLLLVRVFPMLTEAHLLALSITGGITVLVSAIGALCESDMRRWLAWVTAFGIGSSFAALGAGSLGGAVLQVVATMFGVAILLLAAGSILHACKGDRRLAHYGGLLFRMPATAILLAHGAGTFLGGPLLAGSDAWSTLLSHSYRSFQNGELRGTISLITLFLSLAIVAAALGRGWSLLFLGRPRDRVVYGPARESATLSVPVAILALIAMVSGHAFLSPVRQLVSVLPAEMSLLAAPDAATPNTAGSFTGLKLAREVAPPIMRPPPAPEDDGLPTIAEESAVPPDDKTPRLIDPLRWTLISLGLLLGVTLPLYAHRPLSHLERLRFFLARGGLLSLAFTTLTAHLLSAGALLSISLERFLLLPLLDTVSSAALPFSRHSSRTAPALLPLVLFTSFVLLLFSVAGIWYTGLLPPLEPLLRKLIAPAGGAQ